MSKKLVCLFFFFILSFSLFVGVAKADVIVNEPMYLSYENGSYVVLPPGNYSSLERIDNVWYVNGEVYSSDLSFDDAVAYVIIGCVLCAMVIAVVALVFIRKSP